MVGIQWMVCWSVLVSLWPLSLGYTKIRQNKKGDLYSVLRALWNQSILDCIMLHVTLITLSHYKLGVLILFRINQLEVLHKSNFFFTNKPI
jgi:hypothetical protein